MCDKSSIKNQKGFTLIELLIIIAVIGILASVILVSNQNSVSRARDARRVTELNSVANALESYSTNERNGYYPTYEDLASVPGGCSASNNAEEFVCLLKILENKGYLKGTFPQDPLNDATYKYELEVGDPNSCNDTPKPQPCGFVNYRIRATLENDHSGSLKANVNGRFGLSDIDGCEISKKYYCIGGDPSAVFTPGKPVIYLYPEKTEKVEVKIYPKEVTNSIPNYGNGWDVIASPDGKLLNLSDNKEYPYLFWDGKSERPIVDRNKGFIIKSENAESFLSGKLKQQGLNQKEADEFIEFWAPKMKSKAYVYVYFMPQADYDKLVPMKIEPRPDVVIRVYMLFKSLDEPIAVQEQTLSSPERKGFTAVEWGGDLSEIK